VRTLVIDDQAFAERADKFSDLPGEVTCVTTFPVLWSIFLGYETIYWDNDLGKGGDVIARLSELYWTDSDLFAKLFAHKKHFVHSANPVANRRICHLLESVGADVTSRPITNWN